MVCKGVFRNVSNIVNVFMLLTIFAKKFHLNFLTTSQIRVWCANLLNVKKTYVRWQKDIVELLIKRTKFCNIKTVSRMKNAFYRSAIYLFYLYFLCQRLKIGHVWHSLAFSMIMLEMSLSTPDPFSYISLQNDFNSIELYTCKRCIETTDLELKLSHELKTTF